ncbi:TetR/AcrR family transcriptional regulator [Kordiimonas sp. SCSIO 12603]|uniref:TetR/AcrR family transcriptional regulator n=1 Tax=Kordiimonas sp. SCSIO 12603 TaxID=2829596 RepID=UPI002102519B|nr:TetR/AcrR family transcriptional regulator [Kordiimonas sp. SCSIO 12603]UTW59324.1 TetR/AcrR family transcriptional regulator [Kordiimonas sp. SCSIO 12603]
MNKEMPHGMGKAKRRVPLTKRGENTVSKILDATSELLFEYGYSKLTTNHIAKKAGMSIGTLYQYFEDKETILYALTLRWYDHINADFEEIYNTVDDQVSDIYEMFHRLYKRIYENQYLDNEVYIEIMKVIGRVPEIAELRETHIHNFTTRIIALFERFGYRADRDDLYQVALFIHQVSGFTMNLTVLGEGKARDIRLKLGMGILDNLIDAAIELCKLHKASTK